MARLEVVGEGARELDSLVSPGRFACADIDAAGGDGLTGLVSLAIFAIHFSTLPFSRFPRRANVDGMGD